MVVNLVNNQTFTSFWSVKFQRQVKNFFPKTSSHRCHLIHTQLRKSLIQRINTSLKLDFQLINITFWLIICFNASVSKLMIVFWENFISFWKTESSSFFITWIQLKNKLVHIFDWFMSWYDILARNGVSLLFWIVISQLLERIEVSYCFFNQFLEFCFQWSRTYNLHSQLRLKKCSLEIQNVVLI